MKNTKLEKDDFYQQFHNEHLHTDHGDADRSIMDRIPPHDLYRTGKKVSYAKKHHLKHR